MTGIIRSAEIDHEPVILTYRRPERAPLAPLAAPDLPLMSEVRAPPPLAPAPPPVPLEDPETALKALRKAAFEEGYREGAEAAGAQARTDLAADRAALDKDREALELGHEKDREALRSEHESLVRLIGSVREALDRGIDGAEDGMVEIAFAAVCRVLGEAAATEEGVRGAVREAMRESRSREKVVVRISAADHARLAAEPDRLQRLGDELKVELAADGRVALGGCLIETAGGTLDARLEVQLRQLIDTLVKARGAGDTLT